jgi:hypothetical protein
MVALTSLWQRILQRESRSRGEALPEEITLNDLTAITLDRHLLRLERTPHKITDVVGRICGLNAQTARGPYISLWNRMDGFTKSALDEALYKQKILIKAWLVRGTAHIVPTADFPVYQKALRRNLCDGWEASLKKQTLIDLPRTWNRFIDAIAHSLAEGPLMKRDLLARVKGLIRGYSETEQKRLVGWGLRLLTYQGRVCHDRPTGPWYHFKDNRFALVTNWLPAERVEATGEDEARHDLLIKYLGGYGPATIQDFAYWTGLKMPEAKGILDAVRGRLAEIRVKGLKRPLWILADQIDSLEHREQGTPISFLPEFDPLIMGHKAKSRVLDPEDHPKVFQRLATVRPTFLVNGRVAGTWDYSFSHRSLKIEPFGKAPRKTRDAILSTSESLQQFLET